MAIRFIYSHYENAKVIFLYKYKAFKSWDHLVTMLFGILSRCDSMAETCEGYEGEDVWVIPSRKLVIVRMALEHGDQLNAGRFLGEVLAAVR